jgi:DNA repair exonuclease SbcCD ATPase subunit
LHRISDIRVGGIAQRNFSMFRQLCGEKTLKNVVIVTTMWGNVNLADGEAREAELASRDIFFKPVLQKHAQMARSDHTVESAQAILRMIIRNHPLALRIQEELIDEHKDISETAAGEELNREFMRQMRRHKEELNQLKKEMAAARNQDEETRRELEDECRKLVAKMEQVKTDSQRLRSDYDAEMARLEQKMQDAAAQTKRELDHVSRKYEEQLRAITNASAAEKADMMQQLDEYKRQISGLGGRGGIFTSLGRIVDSLLGF